MSLSENAIMTRTEVALAAILAEDDPSTCSSSMETPFEVKADDDSDDKDHSKDDDEDDEKYPSLDEVDEREQHQGKIESLHKPFSLSVSSELKIRTLDHHSSSHDGAAAATTNSSISSNNTSTIANKMPIRTPLTTTVMEPLSVDVATTDLPLQQQQQIISDSLIFSRVVKPKDTTTRPKPTSSRKLLSIKTQYLTTADDDIKNRPKSLDHSAFSWSSSYLAASKKNKKHPGNLTPNKPKTKTPRRLLERGELMSIAPLLSVTSSTSSCSSFSFSPPPFSKKNAEKNRFFQDKKEQEQTKTSAKSQKEAQQQVSTVPHPMSLNSEPWAQSNKCVVTDRIERGSETAADEKRLTKEATNPNDNGPLDPKVMSDDTNHQEESTAVPEFSTEGTTEQQQQDETRSNDEPNSVLGETVASSLNELSPLLQPAIDCEDDKVEPSSSEDTTETESDREIPKINDSHNNDQEASITSCENLSFPQDRHVVTTTVTTSKDDEDLPMTESLTESTTEQAEETKTDSSCDQATTYTNVETAVPPQEEHLVDIAAEAPKSSETELSAKFETEQAEETMDGSSSDHTTAASCTETMPLTQDEPHIDDSEHETSISSTPALTTDGNIEQEELATAVDSSIDQATTETCVETTLPPQDEHLVDIAAEAPKSSETELSAKFETEQAEETMDGSSSDHTTATSCTETMPLTQDEPHIDDSEHETSISSTPVLTTDGNIEQEELATAVDSSIDQATTETCVETTLPPQDEHLVDIAAEAPKSSETELSAKFETEQAEETIDGSSSDHTTAASCTETMPLTQDEPHIDDSEHETSISSTPALTTDGNIEQEELATAVDSSIDQATTETCVETTLPPQDEHLVDNEDETPKSSETELSAELETEQQTEETVDGSSSNDQTTSTTCVETTLLTQDEPHVDDSEHETPISSTPVLTADGDIEQEELATAVDSSIYHATTETCVETTLPPQDEHRVDIAEETPKSSETELSAELETEQQTEETVDGSSSNDQTTSTTCVETSLLTQDEPHVDDSERETPISSTPVLTADGDIEQEALATAVDSSIDQATTETCVETTLPPQDEHRVDIAEETPKSSETELSAELETEQQTEETVDGSSSNDQTTSTTCVETTLLTQDEPHVDDSEHETPFSSTTVLTADENIEQEELATGDDSSIDQETTETCVETTLPPQDEHLVDNEDETPKSPEIVLSVEGESDQIEGTIIDLYSDQASPISCVETTLLPQDETSVDNEDETFNSTSSPTVISTERESKHDTEAVDDARSHETTTADCAQISSLPSKHIDSQDNTSESTIGHSSEVKIEQELKTTVDSRNGPANEATESVVLTMSTSYDAPPLVPAEDKTSESTMEPFANENIEQQSETSFDSIDEEKTGPTDCSHTTSTSQEKEFFSCENNTDESPMEYSTDEKIEQEQETCGHSLFGHEANEATEFVEAMSSSQDKVLGPDEDESLALPRKPSSDENIEQELDTNCNSCHDRVNEANERASQDEELVPDEDDSVASLMEPSFEENMEQERETNCDSFNEPASEATAAFIQASQDEELVLDGDNTFESPNEPSTEQEPVSIIDSIYDKETGATAGTQTTSTAHGERLIDLGDGQEMETTDDSRCDQVKGTCALTSSPPQNEQDYDYANGVTSQTSSSQDNRPLVDNEDITPESPRTKLSAEASIDDDDKFIEVSDACYSIDASTSVNDLSIGDESNTSESSLKVPSTEDIELESEQIHEEHTDQINTLRLYEDISTKQYDQERQKEDETEENLIAEPETSNDPCNGQPNEVSNGTISAQISSPEYDHPPRDKDITTELVVVAPMAEGAANEQEAENVKLTGCTSSLSLTNSPEQVANHVDNLPAPPAEKPSTNLTAEPTKSEQGSEPEPTCELEPMTHEIKSESPPPIYPTADKIIDSEAIKPSSIITIMRKRKIAMQQRKLAAQGTDSNLRQASSLPPLPTSSFKQECTASPAASPPATPRKDIGNLRSPPSPRPNGSMLQSRSSMRSLLSLSSSSESSSTSSSSTTSEIGDEQEGEEVIYSHSSSTDDSESSSVSSSSLTTAIRHKEEAASSSEEMAVRPFHSSSTTSTNGDVSSRSSYSMASSSSACSFSSSFEESAGVATTSAVIAGGGNNSEAKGANSSLMGTNAVEVVMELISGGPSTSHSGSGNSHSCSFNSSHDADDDHDDDGEMEDDESVTVVMETEHSQQQASHKTKTTVAIEHIQRGNIDTDSVDHHALIAAMVTTARAHTGSLDQFDDMAGNGKDKNIDHNMDGENTGHNTEENREDATGGDSSITTSTLVPPVTMLVNAVSLPHNGPDETSTEGYEAEDDEELDSLMSSLNNPGSFTYNHQGEELDDDEDDDSSAFVSNDEDLQQQHVVVSSAALTSSHGCFPSAPPPIDVELPANMTGDLVLHTTSTPTTNNRKKNQADEDQHVHENETVPDAAAITTMVRYRGGVGSGNHSSTSSTSTSGSHSRSSSYGGSSGAVTTNTSFTTTTLGYEHDDDVEDDALDIFWEFTGCLLDDDDDLAAAQRKLYHKMPTSKKKTKRQLLKQHARAQARAHAAAGTMQDQTKGGGRPQQQASSSPTVADSNHNTTGGLS